VIDCWWHDPVCHECSRIGLAGLQTFTRFANELGGIFYTRVLHQPMVVVADPALWQQALAPGTDLPKGGFAYSTMDQARGVSCCAVLSCASVLLSHQSIPIGACSQAPIKRQTQHCCHLWVHTMYS
jgi:hypothetical protein